MREQAAATHAQERQELAKLERAQQTDESAAAAQSQRERELSQSVRDLQAERTTLAARQSRASAAVGTLATQLAHAETQLAATRTANTQAKSEYEDASVQLGHVQEQLREAKLVGRASERETRLRELVETLQRLFGASAVHGRVGELVVAQSAEFQRAVNVVLGAQVDALVVENDQIAQDCVRYLREQRLGVATFLPLNALSVEGKTLGEGVGDGLRTLHAQVRPVQDVLHYDRRYQRVVDYCCGRTLLCQSLDLARKFAFGTRQRHKTVALDGTLISKAGFVTGGTSEADVTATDRNGGGGGAARRRWDEAQLRQLKQRRDTLLTQLNQLGATMRGFATEEAQRSERDTLQQQLARAKTEAQLGTQRLQDCETLLANTQTQLAAATTQLQALQTGMDARTTRIKALSATIAAAEQTLYGAFERKAGLAAGQARDFEQRQMSLQREATERRLALQTQRSRVTHLLAFEKSRALDEEASVLRGALEADQRLLTQRQAEADEAQERVDALSGQLREATRQNKQVVSEGKLAQLETELKTLKKAHESRQKLLAALQKQVTTHDATADTVRERRHALYRQCALEQPFELPLQEGSAPLPSPDELEALSGSEPSQLRARAAREEQILVDFEALSAKWKAATTLPQREELLLRVAQDIQLVQADLDKLAPNLKAVERLDDVQQRLGSAKDELQTAKAAKDETARKFERVRHERDTLFNEAFTHISQNIDEIYKQVTGGAGMAVLSVDALQDAFLHGVRYSAVPPSKSFRDIVQLSGGEKTVAALALLFAIHSFRPAPFFIMDEVDAALDATNVVTVAKYLKERSSQVQMIVISLKPQCYDKADSLVGVCVDAEEDTSKTLTLDLTEYDQ